MDQEYLTDEWFAYMDALQIYCETYIKNIRAVFDNLSLEEQTEYEDAINDFEHSIIDCKIYKKTYEKYHKQELLETLYRVKDGDTLITIAVANYGNPMYWQFIYRYNQLKDLDLSGVRTLSLPRVTVDEDDF